MQSFLVHFGLDFFRMEFNLVPAHNRTEFLSKKSFRKEWIWPAIN